jgi:hypothetical protein
MTASELLVANPEAWNSMVKFFLKHPVLGEEHK